MKFKVVNTKEFSEEDLQYAVKKALKYLDNDERLHTACHYAYWDMIDQRNDYELVTDWEWCIFENAVTDEIERRLEIYYCG